MLIRTTSRKLATCAAAAFIACAAFGATAAAAATGGLPGTGDRLFDPAHHTGDNHCLEPDANTELGFSEQLVLPGLCDVVEAGEFYVPGVFPWHMNTTFESVPQGFVPTGATPAEDFVAKAGHVTYTVDAGTRAEKRYTFDVADIVNVYSGEAVGFLPTAFFIAKLPPLPPGEHTVEAQLEMKARHCDGLGTARYNCLEPGVQYDMCPLRMHFTVVPKATRSR